MKPWYVKVGDRFPIADVDLRAFKKHLSEEYKPGYSSWENTENGLLAEHMLYSRGYKDLDEDYQDVVSPDDVNTEVKSTWAGNDVRKYAEKVIYEGYGKNPGLWVRRKVWKKKVADRLIIFERYEEYYEVALLMEWNDSADTWIEVEGDKERI